MEASVGLHKNPSPIQTPTTMQNMRLTFASDGTSIYKHVPSTSPPYQKSATVAPDGSAAAPPPIVSHHPLPGEPQAKRKRGRPRKYGTDRTVNLSSPPASGGAAGFAAPVAATSPHGQPSRSDLGSPGVPKKARGRPPGSGKKQQMNALGSAGTGFTPHVLTVKAGEDVSSVIMSFLQHGSRAVCILSANGAISNVTLRQAATSGGTVTYEGRFEILSLSGSFLLSESGGQRSRTGGLSVSLAGPDGRVLGGGVAGLLTAASPVQVVVGSFITMGKKEAKETNVPDTTFSPRPFSISNAGASSPPSRGTPSESSGGPSSPHPQQSAGFNNCNQHPIPGILPWK